MMQKTFLAKIDALSDMLSFVERSLEHYGCPIKIQIAICVATIFAVSDQNDADIFCSGAVINRSAKIDGEIDAVGGVHNRDEI